MKESKLIGILKIIAWALFILTFAIAFTILCRPFYNLHVSALNLCETTGYPLETILTAYNEMLDFCIGIRNDFACGALAFSLEGASHFADCRVLFMLDFIVLAVSFVVLVVLTLLEKKGIVAPTRFKGHQNSYHAALFLLVSFSLIALLGLSDFDRLFTLFHTLMFPGKTNWVFDPRYDQIIEILPEIYFADCGLLIVLIILAFCVGFIIHDRKALKNAAQKA